MPLFQFFRYNTLAEILRGDVIIPAPHLRCVIKVDKGAVINKRGITVLGQVLDCWKALPETLLRVSKGGTLKLGPNIRIRYGAAIMVEETEC